MSEKLFLLASEGDTGALAGKLALLCVDGIVIYLQGDLGAGKTAFCRSFIRALGYAGRVKSPTYTLVEPYEVNGLRIFHFDLYRLADPEELEFIGIRDYFSPQSLCLIEWPDKGAQLLATADLEISIEFEPEGRRFHIHANSPKGQKILAKLQ